MLNPAVISQGNSRPEPRKLFLRKQFVRRGGACLLEWRKVVCGVMIVILPTSVLAQDSSRAMLHSDGGVWLNGNPAPNSSAIFTNDLVQTQKGTTAKIDADGSTATVQSETIVQFDGDELALDHGGLELNTSRAMRVRVNCITVTPLSQEWTRYDVIDVDGRVTVAALEHDVRIHYRDGVARRSKEAGSSSDVTVHQGEQVTRDERCGAAVRDTRVVDADGAILNSVWAKAAGLTVIGVLTCWALCRGNEPVSPSAP
jgi:hypothetical protein